MTSTQGLQVIVPSRSYFKFTCEVPVGDEDLMRLPFAPHVLLDHMMGGSMMIEEMARRRAARDAEPCIPITADGGSFARFDGTGESSLETKKSAKRKCTCEDESPAKRQKKSQPTSFEKWMSQGPHYYVKWPRY